MTEGTLCLCGHHAWSHATQPYKDGHLRLDGPCLERDGCGSFNGKGVFARWIDHGERPSHPIGAPCAICEGFQAWVEPSIAPLPLTKDARIKALSEQVACSQFQEKIAIERRDALAKELTESRNTVLSLQIAMRAASEHLIQYAGKEFGTVANGVRMRLEQALLASGKFE